MVQIFSPWSTDTLNKNYGSKFCTPRVSKDQNIYDAPPLKRNCSSPKSTLKGTCITIDCQFCEIRESIEHMNFECQFTRPVWFAFIGDTIDNFAELTIMQGFDKINNAPTSNSKDKERRNTLCDITCQTI